MPESLPQNLADQLTALDNVVAGLYDEHQDTPVAPESKPPVAVNDTPSEDMSDFLVDDTPPEASTETSVDTTPTPDPATTTVTSPQAPRDDYVRELEARLIALSDRVLNSQHNAVVETPAPQVEQDIPLYSDEELTISPELEEAYKEASPFIAALVKKELAKFAEAQVKPLRQTMNQAREALDVQKNLSMRASDEAFSASVRAAVPDIEAKTKHAGWQEYLNKPAPFSGGAFSVRDALQTAVATQNLSAVKEILDRIHEKIIPHKNEIISGARSLHGIPVSKKEQKLQAFLSKVMSDPFIPSDIRSKILDLVEGRLNAMRSAHHIEIEKYQEGLKSGMYWDTLDGNDGWLHNKISRCLYKSGYGISDVESQVHKIRTDIQLYFEGFNPIKKSNK